MALVGSLSGSVGLIAVTGSFEPGFDNVYYSGTTSKRWSSVVSTAFTGSLTKLTDGSDFLRAGSNVTLTTGSSGEVTITATSTATTPGGNNYSVQYNSGSAFGGSNDLTWTYDTTKVFGVNGQISASLGITGSDVFINNLTSGSVIYAIAGGKLSTDAGMTYNDGTDVLTVGGSTFGNDVTIAGDLTVNGTTTTINTNNLLVEDPIIVMGTGAVSLNSNGGIAIVSGSNQGGAPDLVFGRVANDTWGVGALGTNLGTTGSLEAMTLVKMRASEFQVNGTVSVVKETGGVLIASGSTVALSGSTSIDFVRGGTRFAYVGASTDVLPLDGLFPSSDDLYNLGSPDLRWKNIYTGDLHLRNERGDYTLIEEEDFLSIRFNKTGKRYKFVLERVPELDEK